MKCELQVIRETWRVRTDFERIAGCFRYVNDQTTDRAGFLVHKILFLVLNSRIYCGRSPHGERGLKCESKTIVLRDEYLLFLSSVAH